MLPDWIWQVIFPRNGSFSAAPLRRRRGRCSSISGHACTAVDRDPHTVSIASSVVERARRKRDDARNGPRVLFIIGNHPPTDA